MKKTDKGTVIYQKGETIIREGEKDKTIYFLVSGKVGIYKGRKLISVLDKPNSPIGEISAILETPRTATCIALEESELVAYKGGIDEIIAKYPKTTKAIIKSLAERVAKSTEELGNIQSENQTDSQPSAQKMQKEEKEVESQTSQKENFSIISEIPDEYLQKFLSTLTEKELAIILTKSSDKIKSRIEKHISKRKMDSLKDIIIFYSKNGLSNAEIEVLHKKIEDVAQAIAEAENKQSQK
jgi:CRP-like cAMP-binding protein